MEKRKLSWVIAIVAAMLAAPLSGFAGPFSIMIGDNDGFGFGAGLVPDNANLLNINLPEDRRSPAEAASVNGAQQTDFYSANFNPLPSFFDVFFTIDDVTSATFTVDMGGFQASQFGQLGVAYNGVAQANLFNFQDGVFETRVRSFGLDAATIASIQRKRLFQGNNQSQQQPRRYCLRLLQARRRADNGCA